MAANSTLVDHYSTLIRETAREKLKIVLAKNGLPEHPNHVSQIRPVPVWEKGEDYSLLDLVSERMPTTVSFPLVGDFNYVPAYYKKYRDTSKPRGYRCDIVVMDTNYCYARLFIAKELMHCSIDDDGIPATNSFDEVNKLINELSTNCVISPQTIIDEVAWQGAMLFTIPETWIPLLKKLHADYCVVKPGDEDEAYGHLAHLLRVPKAMLKLRMEIC